MRVLNLHFNKIDLLNPSSVYLKKERDEKDEGGERLFTVTNIKQITQNSKKVEIPDDDFDDEDYIVEVKSGLKSKNVFDDLSKKKVNFNDNLPVKQPTTTATLPNSDIRPLTNKITYKGEPVSSSLANQEKLLKDKTSSKLPPTNENNFKSNSDRLQDFENKKTSKSVVEEKLNLTSTIPQRKYINLNQTMAEVTLHHNNHIIPIARSKSPNERRKTVGEDLNQFKASGRMTEYIRDNVKNNKLYTEEDIIPKFNNNKKAKEVTKSTKLTVIGTGYLEPQLEDRISSSTISSCWETLNFIFNHGPTCEQGWPTLSSNLLRLHLTSLYFFQGI